MSILVEVTWPGAQVSPNTENMKPNTDFLEHLLKKKYIIYETALRKLSQHWNIKKKFKGIELTVYNWNKAFICLHLTYWIEHLKILTFIEYILV